MAQNAVFQRLSEIAEVASLDKEERLKYDESLRAYRDTIAVMDGQYELGAQKGRVEGVAEGEARGRAEERLGIARSFKAMGLPPEQIAAGTGLTLEEIEKL